MRSRFALVLVLAALSGCGSEGAGVSDAEVKEATETALQTAELIYRYCSYGSVSEAQLDGCVDHVKPGEILDLRTNAARFARYEITRCLYDAGPFCKAGD